MPYNKHTRSTNYNSSNEGCRQDGYQNFHDRDLWYVLQISNVFTNTTNLYLKYSTANNKYPERIMYSLQQQTFNAAVRTFKRNVARRNKIALGPVNIIISLNKQQIVENTPKKIKKKLNKSIWLRLCGPSHSSSSDRCTSWTFLS